MSLVTFIVDVLDRPRRRRAATPEQDLLRAVAAQRAGGTPARSRASGWSRTS